MPLIVLAALVVAFWSPVSTTIEGAAPSRSPALLPALTQGAAATAALGIASALIAGRLARRAIAHGQTVRDRRRLARSGRAMEILALLAFGWLIHGAGWPTVVADRLHLRGWLLLDEAVILLPFPLMLLAVWAGLFPAERALKATRASLGRSSRLGGHLIGKSRQAFGLVLPVALLFGLVQDVDDRLVTMTGGGAWVHLGLYAGLGGVILVLAPAFVRLSWPSTPLPPGPLRDRLERLARRFGFRYTDILVWDTGGTLINAGVTGALPWFRYVLLTDAMIENLSPRQVEAVFGHEVGHIAHRHLTYFGVFFLGTMGVMALLSAGIDQVLSVDSPFWIWGTSRWVEVALQIAVALGFALAYFLLLFGFLSRRFERQADVFGCRVVSCGRPDCPPHPDVNAHPTASPGVPEALCPVGIGIFIEALTSVATLNGLEPHASSWRHGSIARRIAFLRALEGRPEAERRFQARIRRLRLALALVLLAALLAAIRSGAIEAMP